MTLHLPEPARREADTLVLGAAHPAGTARSQAAAQAIAVGLPGGDDDATRPWHATTFMPTELEGLGGLAEGATADATRIDDERTVVIGGRRASHDHTLLHLDAGPQAGDAELTLVVPARPGPMPVAAAAVSVAMPVPPARTATSARTADPASDAAAGVARPGSAPAQPTATPGPASAAAGTATAPSSTTAGLTAGATTGITTGVTVGPDSGTTSGPTTAARRETPAQPVADAAARPPRARPAPIPFEVGPTAGAPRSHTAAAARAPTPATSGRGGHTLTGLPGQAPGAQAGGGDGLLREVGRYQIQSRLGRGGMASVYRAHDPQLQRDVAIKFLHASLAEDADCHARFLREARAEAQLQHPNIVVVHEVGEIEGRPYIAMELIDGEPLADLLDRQRQLPLADVLRYGIQLAQALDYAHAHGIVHRDVKPANVMVLPRQRLAKLTDFGIARVDSGDDAHTQIGSVLGTPQYMSPEQTRGEVLDGRSDLFSVGVVLYQMVAGERPFRGDSLIAVAGRIVNDTPPPLQQARPDVPPALRRVIERCLAKQPAQRWQSGQELAEALQKVQAELEAAAQAAGRPRIVPLRVQWALAMAAVVLLVMGVTASVITQRQQAALLAQAVDYGAGMARFLARQQAPSALAEEWEVIDVAVQQMMESGRFERIVVVDPAGTVRASSLPGTVGKPWQDPGRAVDATTAAAAGQDAAAPRVSRLADASGADVLGFDAPMLFQSQSVGRVVIGLPEAPLRAVSRLSLTLMAVLVLVTVSAVALAMYLLGDRFARPIRLVCDALRDVTQGRYGHAIGERRRDEFGALYAGFDEMTQALQARHPDAVPLNTRPPTGIRPPDAAAQPAAPQPR